MQAAAGDRPILFLDVAWAEHRPEPTLLLQTNMAEGMTERDCDELLAFAASVRR